MGKDLSLCSPIFYATGYGVLTASIRRIESESAASHSQLSRSDYSIDFSNPCNKNESVVSFTSNSWASLLIASSKSSTPWHSSSSAGIKAMARIRHIFLDGYGVLVVRTIIFKISSFKLQNACLLVNLNQGTSELVEDTEDESLDSNTKGEGSEDEGPSSEEEEAAPEVSPSSPAVPTLVASPVDSSPVASPATVEAESFLAELRAQVEFRGGLIHDRTQRLDVLPPALFEGYDRDFRELYTRSRAVRDEIFSQWYRLRSLEQDQERATVTFGAIWRSVLALESWAGHVDVQRAEMWHARYDDHRLIHDLLVQNTMMQRCSAIFKR
ncbi:hypothetical protein Tco_0503712 [Tanacetum coccineum]